MKKVLTIILLIWCTALYAETAPTTRETKKTSDTLKIEAIRYTDKGKDTYIYNNDSSICINLHKGVVFYGKVYGKIGKDSLAIGVDTVKFIRKPILDGFERLSQKELDSLKNNKIRIVNINFNALADSLKKSKGNSVFLCVKSDTISLILNDSKADVDIYNDGKYRFTVNSGKYQNIEEKIDWGKMTFCMQDYLPQDFTLEESAPKPVAKSGIARVGEWLKKHWLISTIIGLFLLLLLTILALILRKKIRKFLRTKKKSRTTITPIDNFEPDDSNFMEYNKNVETTLTRDILNIVDKKDNKKPSYVILQKIPRPDNDTKANTIIKKIASYYHHLNSPMKDKIKEVLKKAYKNPETSSTWKIPLYTSKETPKAKNIKFLKQYNKWVEFIPINTSDNNNNKSAEESSSSDPFEDMTKTIGELETLLISTDKNTSSNINGKEEIINPENKQENNEQEESLSQQSVGASPQPTSIFQTANTLILRLKDTTKKVKDNYPTQLDNHAKKELEKQLEAGMLIKKEEHEASIQERLSAEKKVWEKGNEKLKQKVAKYDQVEKQYEQEKKAKEKSLKEIDDKKAEIVRLEKESEEYRSQLLFFKSCQSFAQKAVSFLDTATELRAICTKMYEASRGNVNTISQYMQRADNKFNSAVAKVKDFDNLCAELRTLVTTGLVANGKILHQLLKGKQDAEQIEALRLKLYRDLFSYIGGAAVIMADEYAYTIIHYVPETDKAIAQQIGKLSEKLQNQLEDMGYQLCYAKPLTSCMDYEDVESCGSRTEADTKSFTILEVADMALNYGTNKKKTKVIIQQ